MMAWRRPFGAGALLAGVLGLTGVVRSSNVSEGGVPPNVAGSWINHEDTSLKDLKGRAVLIEFWGTH